VKYQKVIHMKKGKGGKMEVAKSATSPQFRGLFNSSHHVSKGRQALPAIDQDWFLERMRELDLTQRKVAEMTGINRSTINRLFNGSRPWKTQWTADVANALRVPVSELMARIGTTSPKSTGNGMPFAGTVDASGAVAPPRAGQPRRVDRPDPNDFVNSTAAVRVQAPGRPWDGWTCYFVPVKRIALESVGRLCVIELKNKGGRWLGTLQRGYSAAVWNLFHLDGSVIAEGVDVASASPVVWVRT
jgi:hypothetical protein